MSELFWKKLVIIAQQKAVGLFPVFFWIVYHEQQIIFMANKENFYLHESRSGSECKQNVRMSKDCRRVLELY